MSAPVIDAERALTRDGFDAVLRADLESEISIFPARSWYPSSVGHPCDRALVWNFTRWESKARHDTTLQAIFDHGRDHQPLIYRRLERLGFEVVRESDRPTQWQPKPGVRISGRPDGRIIAFHGAKYRPPRLLEAKSMNGYEWDSISTLDDLRHSPKHWTRAYYAQGQLYALLENLPLGVFALMSKATGMLKVIPYELDYGMAEALLQRIERLQPMIDQAIDPDPIPYDFSVCGGCGFLAQCYPPRDFGDGASVILDPEFIAQLERRETLSVASREFAELDKAVKARLKAEGIKAAVAGAFSIEGKAVEVREYKVPARTDIRYDIRRTQA